MRWRFPLLIYRIGQHTAREDRLMTKLRHVAIKVDNPGESAKFYAEAFELTEVGRVGEGAVYLSDGTVNVALIKITDPEFPNWKPDGLNHIGFVVADVDAAVARAEALGAKRQYAEDEHAGVTWEVKMRAPDGVSFDLTDGGWPGISALD
jgi:catechol 2,3-dioxygenase-like lactoylglutathione lyase family enzyme